MFENIRNLGFEKMVVFDTETTGLTPPADCIIELAALCIPLNNGGEPLIVDQMDEFICLEEGRKLAPKIIELTGITDEMLTKEGKPRDEVARRLAIWFAAAQRSWWRITHNSTVNSRGTCSQVNHSQTVCIGSIA